MTAIRTGVVDGHGHIMEPKDLWTDYIDPAYRHRALAFARSAEGIDYMIVDNKPSPYSYGVAPFVGALVFLTSAWLRWEAFTTRTDRKRPLIPRSAFSTWMLRELIARSYTQVVG